MRIREQEFGNYDSPDIQALHAERKSFGALYYRFPNGESLADCYDRASSFLESLYRSFSSNVYDNCVVIGHGNMILMTLMRMMKIGFEEYTTLDSLHNCEFVVLERPKEHGRYAIAYSWIGGQEKNTDGLRHSFDALAPVLEVWDGSPDAPLFDSMARRASPRE